MNSEQTHYHFRSCTFKSANPSPIVPLTFASWTEFFPFQQTLHAARMLFFTLFLYKKISLWVGPLPSGWFQQNNAVILLVEVIIEPQSSLCLKRIIFRLMDQLLLQFLDLKLGLLEWVIHFYISYVVKGPQT